MTTQEERSFKQTAMKTFPLLGGVVVLSGMIWFVPFLPDLARWILFAVVVLGGVYKFYLQNR